MGGSSGSRPDHLLADGQIQAYDTILVKPNALEAEHPRDCRAEGSIQESTAPLRVFSTLGPALVNPHGNVKRWIPFANLMQACDQLLLPTKHFGI